MQFMLKQSLLYYHVIISSLFVCLSTLHQSWLTVTVGTAIKLSNIRGIGFQSTPPLEEAGVFNVPEGNSSQNTEPPFVA